MSSVPGYKLISHFSRSSPYGGSCVYASSELNFEDIPEVKKLGVENHSEICAFVDKTLKLIVVSVYRPPSRDFQAFIDSEFIATGIIFRGFRVIVCGDFNIDLDKYSAKRSRWLDMMMSFNLSPKIHDYTYIV
ncbi:hypothetical protein HHI36_000275 [Cryptolaemus montrouzieri]|uniref:Endonuclease/exonuclease/phosphatase domain-containing protein n=1 Tax=Cryptolaemus montrouzieri TaxID=559131 RepID=A0ABD2P484_9CUCU